MAVYTNVTFNSVELHILDASAKKVQKTRKSVIGKTLVQTNIIGLGAQQWELNVSGRVVGTTSTNLGTNRAVIEAFDDLTAYAYVDGIHDGNYYVEPGSLEFDDDGDDTNMTYKYSMTLVEE